MYDMIDINKIEGLSLFRCLVISVRTSTLKTNMINFHSQWKMLKTEAAEKVHHDSWENSDLLSVWHTKLWSTQ